MQLSGKKSLQFLLMYIQLLAESAHRNFQVIECESFLVGTASATVKAPSETV